MKTVRRRFGEDTAFGRWCRREDVISSGEGYDLENIDGTMEMSYAWMDYKRGWIMLLEEKCKLAEITFAQNDTFGIIHQAMRFACPRMEL